MSEIREHVAYLSQTIGPRPAGTEEEQQAALYITEKFQSEAGLPAAIEDFNCNPDFDIPKAICSGIAVLVAIVAMIVPMMAIPALILTLAAAGLYAAEAFDRPVVSQFFNKGVSQNVVAKYVPESAGDASPSRRRKVILVANYDSGKVQRELSAPIFGVLPVLKWVALGGMVALPVLSLLRCLISFGGIGLIVFNVLTVAAILCAALSLVQLVLNRTAAYNEGANCNAAGVAVLLDVATRIGRGRVSAAEFEKMQQVEPVVHGEAEAASSGYVPEGAELVYEVGAAVGAVGGVDGSAAVAGMAGAGAEAPSAGVAEGPADAEFEDESPVARLMAAKAAVAALTGKPVSSTINIDVYESLAQGQESAADVSAPVSAAELAATAASGLTDAAQAIDGEALAVGAAAVEAASSMAEGAVVGAGAAAAGAGAAVAAAAELAAEKPDVPEWFVKAQQKAKKSKEGTPVQRSRYADALDAAMRESSSHFREANDAVVSETEQRLRQMRNSIMEVRAPGFERDELKPMPSYPAAAEEQSNAVATTAEAAVAPAPVATDGRVPDAAADALRAGEPVRSLSGVSVAPSAAPVGGQQAGGVADRGTLPDGAAPVAGEPSASGVVGTGTVAPRQAAAEKTGSLGAVDASGASAVAAVAGGAASAADASASQGAPRKRRSLALPSLSGTMLAVQASVSAEQKQPTRRPNDPNVGANRSRSLRSMLPSIGVTGAIPALASQPLTGDAGEGSAAASEALELPLTSVRDAEAPAFDSAVSDSDSFAAGFEDAGFAQGSQGEEGQLAYDEQYDAQAGEYGYAESVEAEPPSYVEMPKSRAARFFDKFRFGRKKNEERQSSPQEWLDVDDEFDARSAGAARGSWESFRQEDAADEAGYSAFDAYGEPVAADGYGAGYADAEVAGYGEYGDYAQGYEVDYAAGSTTQFSPIDGVYEDYSAYEEDDGYDGYDDGYGHPSASFPSAGRRWNGGAFSREQLGRVSTLSEDVADAPQSVASDEIAEELQQIYRFRHPDVNTEVWFVALGSELADNGGMQAFLADHAADLKGAIIVELDALGAGDLSVIAREGLYQPRAASSRMKRYAKKASAALGMKVSDGDMLWKEGSAAFAMKRGHQAMHVAGLADGKPAFCGQKDDVLENVDEETLLRNSDFVMELLKQI